MHLTSEYRKRRDGVVVLSAAEERLRSLGLDSLAGARAFDGGAMIALSSRREVRRIGDADPALWLKRARGRSTLGGRVRSALSRRLGMATKIPLRTEWRALHDLAALGIAVPRPVAAGRRGGFWFLLTEDLPGVDLVRFLRDERDPGTRLAAARAIGEVVAKLAGAHLHFESFVGKHVHVRAAGGRAEVGLLDVAEIGRSQRDARVPMSADLLSTVPDAALSEAEVAGFLGGAGIRGAAAIHAVFEGVRERHARRRLRRFLAADPERHFADRFLGTDGSLWRGPAPFVDGRGAAAALAAGHAVAGGARLRAVWDDAGHIERALDCATQAWRFDVAAGAPVGFVRDGVRSALVFEDDGAAAAEATPLPEFARRDPAGAGALVGRLHRAGLLARGFSVRGGRAWTPDWRGVMRPDPVREGVLRRDAETVAAGLDPAARAAFDERYAAERRSLVEAHLRALAGGGEAARP